MSLNDKKKPYGRKRIIIRYLIVVISAMPIGAIATHNLIPSMVFCETDICEIFRFDGKVTRL